MIKLKKTISIPWKTCRTILSTLEAKGFSSDNFEQPSHSIKENRNINIIYAKTKENSDIIENLKVLQQGFRPSPFLFHNFLQSLYSAKGPSFDVYYNREYIKLSDGGQVALDWAPPMQRHIYQATPYKDVLVPYEPSPDNKILFVVHGLTGSGSLSIHVKYLVRYAQSHGYHVVVFNHRGYNHRLSSPLPAHGGKLEDFGEALNLIKKRYPLANMYSCGISFGGNQLLRLLGSNIGKDIFKAAVAVGSPFDVENVLVNMEGSIYEKSLIRKYIYENVLPNINVLESLKETHNVDFNQVLNSKSMREFHSHFTAKIYRHKDLKEFFDVSKVTDDIIQNIKIPTLCIHAKDDPIVKINTVPVDKLKTNDKIIYATTKYGSHICWLEGSRRPQSVRLFF